MIIVDSNNNRYPKLYNINNLSVTNDDASLDKITLFFSIRYTSTSFNTIERLLKSINCIKVNRTDKLFHNVKRKNRKIDAEIPQDSHLYDVCNILSGTKLEFIRDTSTNNLTCKIKLNINPTTFLAVHFGSRVNELTIENLASMEVNDSLFYYQKMKLNTCDLSDNFLNEELFKATRGKFSDYTSIITAKAIEWLENKLFHNQYLVHEIDPMEYIIANHPFYLRIQEFSITSIETYFEYKVTNNEAILKANDLCEVISKTTRHSKIRDYEELKYNEDSMAADVIPRYSFSVIGKAKCGVVNITRDNSKTIKMYPKTRDRIRIEVGLRGKVKGFCNIEPVGHFANIQYFFNRIIRESIKRMNFYAGGMSTIHSQELQSRQAEGTIFNLTIDLISKLNKIYKDDTAKVKEFCEVLLVNKTIQEPRNKANAVYGNIIINKLIRNEIILKTKLTARNSSGYETYSLHPKYEAYMTQILDIIRV